MKIGVIFIQVAVTATFSADSMARIFSEILVRVVELSNSHKRGFFEK